MPRRPDPPDDPDDEFDLPEGVYHDPADGLYQPCPHCREPVPADAVFCGRCENRLFYGDAPADGRPLWVRVVLVLALLAAVAMALP